MRIETVLGAVYLGLVKSAQLARVKRAASSTPGGLMGGVARAVLAPAQFGAQVGRQVRGAVRKIQTGAPFGGDSYANAVSPQIMAEANQRAAIVAPVMGQLSPEARRRAITAVTAPTTMHTPFTYDRPSLTSPVVRPQFGQLSQSITPTPVGYPGAREGTYGGTVDTQNKIHGIVPR